MTRLIYPFLVTATLASVLVAAGPKDDKLIAQSPEELVTRLYKLHDGKNDPLGNPASEKLLKEYFGSDLANLYLKDQAESKGEVGKLEMDPLYAAQDFEIKNFGVSPAVTRDGKSEVIVKFQNIGTDHQVIFSLVKTKGGWRIADIKYDDGRTLSGILR